MERRIAEVQSHKVAVDITDKKSLLDLISSLRHGSGRRESGLFFVEGARMVREALASGAHIEAVVVCPELCLERDIRDILDPLPSTMGPITVEVGRRRYENAARHFAVKQGPQGRRALCTWGMIGREARERLVSDRAS